MIALVAAIAYLLGSIPVAWIITKLTINEDLRNLGSGNVGVMNVMIQSSRWAGLLVFGAEALKGMLAVWLANAAQVGELAVAGAVLAVVAGTRWSVWLRFHGGRGNTAGMGALLAVSWTTLLVSLAVWGLLRLFIRDSFWATRLTFILVPIVFGVITRSLIMCCAAAPLSLIYLSTQERGSDDHRIIKERWSSFAAFLTSPPRHRNRNT